MLKIKGKEGRGRERQRGWTREREEGREALHSTLATLNPGHMTGTHARHGSQHLPVPGQLCSVLATEPLQGTHLPQLPVNCDVCFRAHALIILALLELSKHLQSQTQSTDMAGIRMSLREMTGHKWRGWCKAQTNPETIRDTVPKKGRTRNVFQNGLSGP